MKLSSKKFLFSGFVAAVLAMSFGYAGLAAAAGTGSSQGEICQGIGVASGSCTSGRDSNIEQTFRGVINILSIIAGFACVVMVIIGGLQYILANGDSSKIGTAKNTIIYALVGIVLVLLAQVIVHFVLNKVGGVTS